MDGIVLAIQPYITIVLLVLVVALLVLVIVCLVGMGARRREAAELRGLLDQMAVRQGEAFERGIELMRQEFDVTEDAHNGMVRSLAVVYEQASTGLRDQRETFDRGLGQVRSEVSGQASQTRTETAGLIGQLRAELKTELTSQMGQTRGELATQLDSFDRRFVDFQQLVNQGLETNAARVSGAIQAGSETSSKALGEVRATVDQQLDALRADNSQKLEQMRQTVDEKLQQTLDARMAQSFRQVSDQLEAVYRGLGEMKGLAGDVGDLKRVLGNVKARGILGEIQLGAILREMLAPDQYETDVATRPGSSRRVEYAVKLPGEDGFVYLPIDSKFPGDTYLRLRDAVDSGDPQAIAAARRLLETTLRSEAKEIAQKYLEPPATTNFAIMFLPFEGLYAEVVGQPGLIETLQREYRVNVAGPSTMAALLNSLQMGFQTVAIQRHADEIQQVLASVKTEFAKYQSVLQKAQKQLASASGTLDELAGKRTRAMERRLSCITTLDGYGGDRGASLGDGRGSGGGADVADAGDAASPAGYLCSDAGCGLDEVADDAVDDVAPGGNYTENLS